MTEKSYWWTTGGAGDGAATYTRADLSEVVRIMCAVNGWEGVGTGYLNDLEWSVPGANTFRVAPGSACVDGKPYSSTANVDVTIPSCSVGVTRIDRIVLRAGWTAQTVRITRIAGTEAGSPVPPAITQTPGTTYDIMLYQVRVNSSGTVNLELDERVYAQVTTNGIKNSAVDHDKVGERVAYLRFRKGGSSTEWATPGTSTTIPTVRVAHVCGSSSVAVTTAMASATITVSWGGTSEFSYSPIPVVTMKKPTSTNIIVTVESIAASSMVISLRPVSGNFANNETITVYWHIFGPE